MNALGIGDNKKMRGVANRSATTIES